MIWATSGSDEAQAIATIHRALDLGVTVIDAESAQVARAASR
jgi:aryl-alcohol dehydrogenase-like predicted oxidoreductase